MFNRIGRSLDRLAQLARKRPYQLDSHAARPCTTRCRPFNSPCLERILVDLQPVVIGIRPHHAEEGRLVAVVKAQPQAEPIRQRHLFLYGLSGINGGGRLVLDHVARHEVAAVRGCVEQHIVRAPLEATIENGLERLVAGFPDVKAQVIAEHDEAPRFAPDAAHQGREGVEVLPRDLDQHQPLKTLAFGNVAVDGFHQRTLAHAARAPKQRIIGAMAAGKLLGVAQKNILHGVDTLEHGERHAADTRHRHQNPGITVPVKGVRIPAERIHFFRFRRQSL